MPRPDYRLGLDVGGTNTDAVIMDTADRVIAKAKVPGTADITGGIVAAIDAVLRMLRDNQQGHDQQGADPGRITHVMLGTTHATNAVLERVKGRPILTVADAEGFARAGVMVGLVRTGARVGFEVNLASTREAGLPEPFDRRMQKFLP